MSLLILENVTKHYRLKKRLFRTQLTFPAIKNINFKLQTAETLAIVGESGSGKSTLAKQLVGIETPTSGNIYFNQKKVQLNDKKQRLEHFRNIRLIFQNPLASLNPHARIGAILDEVLITNTRLSGKQRKNKIIETLTQVGLLAEHQYRYPHMFSNGQQQRIAIARAIILEPKIVIIDESLSALDVSIQAQILNLMQTLQEELGLAYIFISHNLNVIEHIADNVMVMYQGEMVEYGSVEQVFDQPLHPYTQSLFASTPMYRQRFNSVAKALPNKHHQLTDKCCCFSSRCPNKNEICEQQNPPLLTKDNGHQVLCFK